ncbi:probable receptor-like protein kinase At1g11050 [Cajanus cajan]|uniref:non-specific serine/threonine protein kinase n=1 Tax=Cajanus cajan TaxID=3821 RepID=A0A151RC81_CAJCA|nr:probable receptor-like protein kinase At1g11050 [Cajanus cajan]KYP40228.1 putative LRR receptor-like serine/threonine-protein kinase RKF3 [Cajanus cajan]
MEKTHVTFFFLPLLITSLFTIASSSSCPINFSYVQTLPWDTSTCRNPIHDQQHCCQTLTTLFHVGLAQHLKQTSFFQLPNQSTSSTCLSNFQANLTPLSINSSLVPSCFPNPSMFVTNMSTCAGIVTTQDWEQKVGSVRVGPLRSFCSGELSDQTRCHNCVAAGLKVAFQLTSVDPNASDVNQCFSFASLYAAAVVNPQGTTDDTTMGCILNIPLTKGSSKNRGKVVKVVFTVLGCVIIAFVVMVIIYRKWDKRRKENVYHREIENGVRNSVLSNTGAKWFHVSELERATDRFSRRSVVGQGGDGVVYKGKLSDGTLVAIKENFDLENKGDEEFCYEVEIISKIRHRNLLALRGCCISSDNMKGKRRFLVYDFMPNGSLCYQLSLGGANRLTWPQRKNIILDVAKGLAYLHYEIKPPIYHRDIKATNILLDSKMSAKLADFGLAREGSEDQSHFTTRVAGTYGYVAPEYALYGQLTDKSDVYSFGIVILEIMSGRKVLDSLNSSADAITDWVWTLVESGKVEDVFDESIREGPEKMMERFVHVGMLCAHAVMALRPSIAEALKMLEGDTEIPKLPDRPVPLGHASFQSSLLHGLQRSGRSMAC